MATHTTRNLHCVNLMQFRVKLGCPLKTGEYRVRVYHFKADDKKVVLFEKSVVSM